MSDAVGLQEAGGAAVLYSFDFPGVQGMFFHIHNGDRTRACHIPTYVVSNIDFTQDLLDKVGHFPQFQSNPNLIVGHRF